MLKNKKNTKKISVLQVLPHLDSGGLVSGAVEVSAALKKNNFTSVIASSGGYKENEILRHKTILEKVPVDSKNIFKVIANKKRIIKLVRKHNINIIHARSRAPAWSSYWAAKELGIPLVTTFHGTYSTENFLKKKYNSIMLKGEAVIAISKFIKNHIETEYKYKKKIHVIPRGVNIEIFSPKSVSTARLITLASKIQVLDDEKVILMPARLTSWKGHQFAIRAISLIENKKFKLIIVGDTQNRKKYKRKLIKLANELKVQGNIRFINHTRDMPAFLMHSDLVLSCSSKPEAFGRTVLEAQAMGRPVVAFNHGGSIELIKDNDSGVLTQVGNIEELAKAITKVLSYDNLERKKIAKRSIENVKKKYLTEMMCLKTLNLYKSLLKKV
jgi:glycosyltransferase involved in cell wall biosynthesis